MTNRFRTRVAAAAVALTATLALAACSGDDEPAQEPSASTSDDATAAPTGDELTRQDFTATVAAAMAEAGSVHVELDFGTVGATGEGDIQIGSSADDSALDVTVNGNAVVLVDGIFYVNLGQVSGGQYLQVDPGAGGQFASSFGSLLEQANPASQLQLFDSALTDFRVDGAGAEVDGVATTAYVLTLDPATVLTPEQLALAGDDVPDSVEVTILLGGDDLPRRVTTSVAGAEIEIDYSSWGEPVEISAPPADQVTDGAPFGF